jgi:patatin-like phospholipase/acyl hydrolase
VAPPSSAPIAGGQFPFRILSLDGGGIRGAFAAAFLARIEQEIGTPITDHFDLIAGTSTGGITALALGLGEPAARIRDLYEKRGSQIFTRRGHVRIPCWQRACLTFAKRKFPTLDLGVLQRSKYPAEPLREALTEVFGSRTLEEATASRLVIPSVDLTGGR